MFRSMLATVVALSLSAPAMGATPQSWKIDPDHSNFYFTIDHIYSKVRGSFVKKFQEQCAQDPYLLELDTQVHLLASQFPLFSEDSL